MSTQDEAVDDDGQNPALEPTAGAVQTQSGDCGGVRTEPKEGEKDSRERGAKRLVKEDVRRGGPQESARPDGTSSSSIIISHLSNAKGDTDRGSESE